MSPMSVAPNGALLDSSPDDMASQLSLSDGVFPEGVAGKLVSSVCVGVIEMFEKSVNEGWNDVM